MDVVSGVRQRSVFQRLERDDVVDAQVWPLEMSTEI